MSDDTASHDSVAPALEPARGAIRRFASFRTIMALILREMTTRYGRSPGGYVWAIIEPLGMIMILAVGFSLVLRSPPLGNNFILFYATGYLPFNLYQTTSTMVARSINFSKPLLFYPSVTWVDAIIARFLLNTLTGVMVAYILITVLLALMNTTVVLNFGPIVEAMALAAFIGLGIGVLNCALLGLFPIWDTVWSIATRPLFLISGIFFIYEDMPQAAQNIVWYNPLIHVTGIMRTGFYPMYTAEYASPLYAVIFPLLCLVMGLILLKRYNRDILNN